MRRLSRFIYRRAGVILVVALVALPIAAVLAATAIDKLSVGGFTDPDAESSIASELLIDEFDAGSPEVVVLATAKQGTVDDPEIVDAGIALTESLAAEPGVAEVTSYWSLGGAPPLRSTDGTEALVLARLDTTDEKEQHEVAGELAEIYNSDGGELVSLVGGAAEVSRQATEQAEKDLARAELITIPITLLALIVVFGGIVAALLPVGLGIVAIVLTLAVLNIVASSTDVSVFAMNLTTALGLGLAIDYSLFIVSRLREERSLGHELPIALAHTMQTAGRTVAFSAGTVAISLAALVLFPLPFLRTFAFAGAAVVALAAVTALLVLPAVLALLGDRLEALPVLRRKKAPISDEEGFWYRQAGRVMRHPWLVSITISTLLVLLMVPFLRLETGMVDDRVLPESLTSRQVSDTIRSRFESREASALVVVAPGVDATTATDEITSLSLALADLDGVARVDSATGYYLRSGDLAGVDAPPDELSSRFVSDAGTWISVVPAVEPLSGEGEQLANDVREVATPFEVLVGGPSAELIDTKESVRDALPIALAFIALVTFGLLFLMTGSLLVPLKALVLNTLSLTAMFGTMVWIFQDGNLSGFLDFTPTGFIDIATPILMFCIAFGLSMDYEVFVLSRIKEEYDLTGDNDRAVRIGLQKTGGIVTAAATLLAIVFLGIATSSVTVVMMIGIGLTLAVVVDAFFIRATLVPALMKLAGRANWWAPRALRRLHLRFGVFETEPISILDLDEPGEGGAASDSGEPAELARLRRDADS